MEILIIILLFAALLCIWTLSVRRRLEVQEVNIRNAMNQTMIQLSAERKALTALADLLENSIDVERYRQMKQYLEAPQDSKEEMLPEKVAKEQEMLLKVQKIIAESSEQMPLLQTQETYQKYWKAAHSYEHMVKTSSLIYNDSVENFNRMFCKMPDRLAAGICGFHQKKCLEIM